MARTAKQRYPFLIILIPAAAGIMTSGMSGIPVAVSGSCAVLLTGMVWVLRKTRWADLYAAAAAYLLFFSLAQFHSTENRVPYGREATMTARIVELPVEGEKLVRSVTAVGSFTTGDGQWIGCGHKVMLYSRPECGLGAGDVVLFRSTYYDIDENNSSYGRLMRTRSIHGRVYLAPENIIARYAPSGYTPGLLSVRTQGRAVEKVSRLGLDRRKNAVVTAMVAGYRGGLDREVRDHYSGTGASHLLAVSGLHVGIVFMVVNFILSLFPFNFRYMAWRNVVAIAIVWLYAFTSGLSPSAVRAALMFSFAQYALAASLHRNGLNIMFTCGVLMLAVNPLWLRDLSFLLSYSAVLGIVVFYRPVMSLVATGRRWIDVPVSVIVVGCVATFATAPLISYTFGTLPLGGILLNPLLILTANVIVLAGVLWIVSPSFMAAVFAPVLDTAAWLQNSVVEWAAASPLSAVECRLPLWAVIFIYAMYLWLAVAVGRGTEEKPIRLPA